MLGVDSASARPCFDGTTRGSSRISGLSRHVAVVDLALVCVGYTGNVMLLSRFMLLCNLLRTLSSVFRSSCRDDNTTTTTPYIRPASCHLDDLVSRTHIAILVC